MLQGNQNPPGEPGLHWRKKVKKKMFGLKGFADNKQ